MKKTILVIFLGCLFPCQAIFGQVGIGTNAPDSTAILELQSTQRGFLPPRLTTEQRDSIQNPAIGLTIYNLDCHCINFFNGVQWVEYGRDPIESFNCGQVLTDSRTGRSYNTILIGSQCWMAENLDVGEMINNTDSASDNGIIEKYCYGNAPGNCSKLGALYRWNELMQYDTNRYNQGICPEGWHLPNSDEWDTLVNFYGGQSTAGAALKEEGISGFEVLLAGGMKHDDSFYGKSSRGYFWSSASTGSGTGWAYNLNDGNDAFNKVDTVKQNAYSVRCIKGYPNRADTGVVVIDSTVYTLISDSAELAQGIYKYSFGQRNRDDIIVANNIIMGITCEGYIRKVDSISENRDQLTLLTSQATMEDVFVSGEFNLSVPFGDTNINAREDCQRGKITYLAKGVTVNQDRDGFVFGLQDVTLYQDDNVSVIGNGNMQFDPDFKFDFKFRENRVKKLGFYALDAPLVNTIDLTLSVNSAIEYSNEIVLASYEKYFLYWLWGWPVTGVVKLDLKVKNDLSFSAPFEASIGYTNSNTVSFGILYENGTWNKIWNIEKTNTFHPLSIDIGEFDITQKFEIVPEASVKFYGVAGPYFNMSGYEVMNFAYSLPTLDWNSDIKVGLESNLGAEVTIFGLTLAQYNRQLFGFEATLWETPKSLEITSGNNQTGFPGQQLPNPIQVRVKDSRGETFANVPVHFAITSGGGTVQDASVMTDADGYAQTTWTLGLSGIQQVSASVLKANGDNITGSSLIFNASIIELGSPCPGIPTVIYEGSIYNTVQIGNQCWLKENLNVGTRINGNSEQTDNGVIEKYCYFDNVDSCGLYGGLYQWDEMMAYLNIEGSQGICPAGWHIPSENEWKILEGTVDSQYGIGDPEWNISGWQGYDVGTNLKSTDSWYNNGNGPDNFGFSAFPSGDRFYSCSCFENIGQYAFYWSSYEMSDTYAKTRYIYNNDSRVYYSQHNKTNGMSVRCIKNIETTIGEPCPGIPTVTYEGQLYNTVQIGTQCWLKENLNVGTRINASIDQADNSVIEKYCYNDLESNCDVYGGLYQWDEMMQYVTIAGTQGICPAGWHIPTEDDWCTLTYYIDNTIDCEFLYGPSGIDVGTKMKTLTGWNSGGNGTNISGFTALPAGTRIIDYDMFAGLLTETHFWSSSQDIYEGVLSWTLSAQYPLIWKHGTGGWVQDSESIRCIQDD